MLTAEIILRLHQVKFADDGDVDLEYPAELKALAENINNRRCLAVTTDYKVGYWNDFKPLDSYIDQHFMNRADMDLTEELYLSEETLKELVSVCKRIHEDHSLMKELMPCLLWKYDENDFAEIDYTLEVLEEILKVLDGNSSYDVIYRCAY